MRMDDMSSLKRIHGGWKNVPDTLKTKTQLNKMRLKPIGEPIAEVWNSHQWCKLYDIKDTTEMKKLSEKQIAGLKKAQITRRRNEEKKWDEEMQRQEEERRSYGLQTFGTWYESDFVIIDTETTDLDGEIIEIAIIDQNENVLFHSLVKPVNPISNEAFQVHGISDSMLSSAPSWPEVYLKIFNILTNKLILMFNDEFDSRMIYNSCTLWGLKKPNLSTECVMQAYAEYYGLERWVSLQNASGEYVSHRSLDDCFSTLKIVKEIWSELGLSQFNLANK